MRKELMYFNLERHLDEIKSNFKDARALIVVLNPGENHSQDVVIGDADFKQAISAIKTLGRFSSLT